LAISTLREKVSSSLSRSSARATRLGPKRHVTEQYAFRLLAALSFASSLFAQSTESAWEARSVLGVQQAAASSANSRQSFFLDFFIERGLSQISAVDARFLLWGNIRVASVPQQVNSALSLLTPGSGSPLPSANINQLVQSAEFLNGVEFRVWRAHSQNTQRDVGIIAQYGESGPLAPKSSLQIFNLPEPGSPQFATFQGLYGTPPPGAQYAGFVLPDQTSFSKQYGAGFRVTTFDLANPANAPATYSFTVGQDQLVTAGRYRGVVGRFDVFYPLPIGGASFKFVYLFGTVSTRLLARSAQTPALFLEPAAAPPTGPNAYDPTVMLVTSPSMRDYYRIGIGVDALSLLAKLKISLQ
jgi:hypothetical protein